MKVKHGISTLICLLSSGVIANQAIAQGILGGNAGSGVSGAVQGAINNGVNGGAQGAGNAVLNGGTGQEILQQGVQGAINGAANAQLNGQQGLGAGVRGRANANGLGGNLGAASRVDANGNLTTEFSNQLRSRFTTSTRTLGNGPVTLSDRLPQELRSLGFQPGDVLLNADGQPLTNLRDVGTWIGTNGRLNIRRNGENVSVDLAADAATATRGNVAQSLGLSTTGSTEGLVVSNVIDNSLAARAGLQPGDQIIEVNGNAVANSDALNTALSGSQEAATVVYLRGEQRGQARVDVSSVANSSSGNANATLGASADAEGTAALLQRLEAVEREIVQIRAALQTR